jgi:flagellar biosynthesis component FlhA
VDTHISEKVHTELSQYFLNARIQQLVRRLKLSNELSWDQLKESQHGKAIITSVTKILRIAALFKYILKLPVYTSSTVELTSRKEHV